MSSVVVLGDSHLDRISRVFEFPNNFTIVARGGAHLNLWLENKAIIRCHDVCMTVLGGNNLTANPRDALGYKEEIKNVLGQLVQLRNFCKFHNVKLIICQVLNRRVSMDSAFDVIKTFNNRLGENKLKPHYRKLEMSEEFIDDGVHMTNMMYKKLGKKLVEIAETAPVARPDLADVTLQNFH